MKLLYTLAFAAVVLSSCAGGNSKSELSAPEFAEKIKQDATAMIIDVRTPEEYAQGHLINAVNYDWNGDGFEQQEAGLDKSKPLYVYCLSGGRSSSAAGKLRKDGFKEVYELKGGIMKWRASNLPETTSENATVSTGMSMDDFNKLLDTDKSVLIDYYADWCAPCKKLKPIMEEISKEMSDKVVVVRINVDENKNLMKELHIEDLPVIQFYKGKQMYWNHIGFLEKAEIVKEVK